MSRSSEEVEKSSSDALLSDDESYTSKIASRRQQRRCQVRELMHWIAHSTTIVLLLGVYLLPRSRGPLSNEFDLYSPARQIIGDDREIRHFTASFWQKSPFKGPPTDNVIDHWHHITHTPAINLTRDEVQQLGISTDSVQYPEEFGGGYLAYLESGHQLHCLEALWEDHHYRKYPEMFPLLTEKLAELPDIMEHHLEHCVDVLRQQLMCNADAGFVTFRWVEGLSGPYPDFNSKHVCRNYESLISWAETRQADPKILKEVDWTTPETGVVKLAKAP